jgi:diadenosine tetraphosphate (Ap4A) HIT family hydrolase
VRGDRGAAGLAPYRRPWLGFYAHVVVDDCVICRAGRPADVATELSAIWVTIPPWTPLRGYICLVSKRHVREPFELPDRERRAFWDDVDRVAAALNSGLRPDKLNYEIHGNTLPHLHLHMFPRWRSDRFAGLPIDTRDTAPRTDADRAAISAALSGLGTSN